jgi:hypothetical protein
VVVSDNAVRHATGKLLKQVGSRGLVHVWSGRPLRHKITCTECDGPEATTYHRNGPNGYRDALTRWTFHLAKFHPDDDAPCLSALPALRAAHREQDRRERREAKQASDYQDQRRQRRGADLAARLEAQSLADQIVRD